MRIRKTPPKEFEVDRSKWVHGRKNTETLGATSLLNENGNMCCLGFYAKACGATKESILGHGYPGGELNIPLMGEGYNDDYGWSSYRNSALCREAMTANDASTDKKEKETKIKELFKEGGVKLTFTGRYPKGVV